MTGLKTLRIKETDRIIALEKELFELGFNVEIEGDDLIVLPSPRKQHNKESPFEPIQTYKDHRMAMAFSSMALQDKICIEDEMVVAKSYPNYWEDLQQVGFKIS